MELEGINWDVVCETSGESWVLAASLPCLQGPAAYLFHALPAVSDLVSVCPETDMSICVFLCALPIPRV